MSAASDVDTIESRSPSLRPHLRPPPSKSAIFAAYGDPQSGSTRSLPTERDIHPQSSPSPPVPPKKPHFFHWSKSQPNSPPTVATIPSPQILPKIKPKTEPKAKSKTKTELADDITPTDTSSFNLKSFRHVRAPSPSPTPSHHPANATSSTISLSSPVPPRRPRGESVASNSSQRISVAAFREAQARRSLAGSPVPSFRSPSPLLPPTPRATSRPNSPRGSPQPNSRSQLNVPKIPPLNNRVSAGQTSSSTTYTSDSDSSEASSEEEEESDSDHRQSHAFLTGEPLTRRRRTITQRSASNGPEVTSSEDLRARTRAKGRAQSEMGHGFMDRRNEPTPAPRAQSTYTMLSSPKTNGDDLKAVSNANGSRSSMFGSRSRASVSTSALTPSAAAKRASVLVAANANAGGDLIRPSQHRRESASTKTQTAEDSDTDDDDAPLATLLPPRRPGSSMSSASNNTSRSNLNLNSHSNVNLTLSVNTAQPATQEGPHTSPHTSPHPHPNMRKPLIDIKALTSSKPSTGFVPPKENERGFTSGPTLLSTAVLPPITSPSPPARFVSPPSSPPPEHRPRLVTSPTKSSSTSSGASTSAKWGEKSPLPSSLMSDRTQSASPPLLQLNSRRRDTEPPSLPPAADRKRDFIGERLSRAAQQQASPHPPPVPHNATSLPTESTNETLSTEPTIKPRQHRRYSSDLGSASGLGLRVETDGQVIGERTSQFPKMNGDDKEERGRDRREWDMMSDELKVDPKAEPIAPIPIKQRAPPSSFSVTSRPQHSGSSVVSEGGRQRSSTLVNIPASTSGFTNAKDQKSKERGSSTGTNVMMSSTARTRSSTMVPKLAVSAPPMASAPSKPFAARRDSPASSTGDSSSGRAPLTPRDGSELGKLGDDDGESKREEWSGGVSGLGLGPGKGKGHAKTRSVSFEGQMEADVGLREGKVKETADEGESRRRERRRSEAKAAIEVEQLGNVINGRGPILDDDEEDENLPINQAMSGRMMNPMMPMPMGYGPTAGNQVWSPWQQQQAAPQMLSPAQFMLPPPADPNYFVAHQQAMMIAKQAYQMAVAQQAMAAAAEEWERGSSIGGYGGGSVYGGSTAGSLNPAYGMGMGMGMGMGGANGWSSPAPVMFPAAPRSMYGAQSEYGGGGNRNSSWGSRSVYGESFGPSPQQTGNNFMQGASRPSRESGYFPNNNAVPPVPQSRPSPGSRTRTTSTPANTHNRPTQGARHAPPPSSWKPGV